MKNRKIITFIISIAGICACVFFGKDPNAIVALYGVYCCGNVGSKFAYKQAGKNENS